MVALVVLCQACEGGPEAQLVGRWQQSGWAYEKLDSPEARPECSYGRHIEAFEGRSIARHEVEYWEATDDGMLEVVLSNGTHRMGRWRLKGRGHMLTIRYGDGSVEVYDIKELDTARLTLRFDLGVEVRGIARFDFRRQTVSAAELSAEARL